MTIITEPAVYTIAMTKIDRDMLDAWAEEHGLTSAIRDQSTPLSQIADRANPYNLVEFAGRHCYRSWTKGRPTQEYIANIIREDHGSVLEHVNLTFAISGVSRTLTHELVRHRVGVAISQESQRYVNAKDINFVLPPLYLWMCEGDLKHPKVVEWIQEVERTRATYIDLMNHQIAPVKPGSTIEHKRLAEAARSVLSNAAETRLTWTANIRTLRHFFMKRGAHGADLEIRRLAVALFNECIEAGVGNFFYDMDLNEGDFGVPVINKFL